ncbi:MAG TPA: RNA polymerase sigma factor SigZ [Spirochaetota bacterium]
MDSRTTMIWNNFSEQLRKFIIRSVTDQMLADDILQEVFLKIHARIDSLKDDSKIRSWVYQIARNTIIDCIRQKSRERTIYVDFPDQIESIAAPETSSDDGPAREIAEGLKGMIEALPDIYAQALLLVEFEGVSQAELAERLGISFSGAKSRVQRGRQMLRDGLMNCCHFEFDRYGTIIDVYPVCCCCCHQSCE